MLEVLEKIGSVVVPIAVALYAMLYLGIQNVYYVFGIPPEQAGLDQSTIFGRLIGTLVQLFLLLLPLLGLAVGVGWLLNLVTGGWAGKGLALVREKPWIAAAFAALLSGVAYWSYLGVMWDLSGLPVTLAVVGVALFGLLVPYRLLRRRPNGRAGMKVLTGALVGMGLGFVLIGQMAEGANDIYTNGNGNVVLDLVGFQNQWATVHNGDDKPLLKDDDRMLVLGEKEGAYVFYNCGTQETLRRPIEATILGNIELDPDFSNGGADEVEPCGYANKEGE